jgi:hypothetical protein
MSKWLAALALVLVWNASSLSADYRVEATSDPPPSELAADVVAQLAPKGYKVIQGEKRVVCEVWPAKSWKVKADFHPSDTILYPFEVGELIGALRFPRKGADFRGQDIAAGVYTLRYGNQPVDGNHVGTFDTRDFLLMVPAADDQSPATVAEADLFKESAQSAGSTHPAIMPLLKPEKPGPAALRHVEEKEWWALHVPGKDSKGGDQSVELIVVGKAAE